MQTLIEQSREQAKRNAAARAEYEAESEARSRAEATERTLHLLGEWGVSLTEMTPRPDHPWHGVVEVEGLLFYRSSLRYESGYVRRVVRCPDCGAWAASETMSLADLARNVDQEAAGERWPNGAPVWIDRQYHDECPARQRKDAPAPKIPTTAERLVELIRQIASEEVEARLPAVD